MTIREWFRIQRRSMWESAFIPKSEVDDVARLIAFAHSTPPMDYIGGFIWVCVPEEVIARDEAMAQAAERLHRAFRVLGHVTPGTYGAIRRSDCIWGIAE